MVQLRLLGLVAVLGVVVFGWILTCAAGRLDRMVAGVGPLDPRSFERLTLVTAGTGGAYENPDRRGPAVAIGLGRRVALVDAGRAVAESLRAATIPVTQPDTVHLTGLLPENTVGLDDLLLTSWRQGRDVPLRLVGPPGTRHLAEGIVSAHGGSIAALARALALDPEVARFEVVEVGPGWSEERDGLRAEAGGLPGGPLEALAWRFEAGERSVVVAGTGWNTDALAAFARGANTLVHEAVFVPDAQLAGELGIADQIDSLNREAALHTAIDQVGDVARRAGVETLVLLRLRPPPVYDLQLTTLIDDDFDGRIVIAGDGDEFTP